MLELARASETNENTVSSWLRRQAGLFDTEAVACGRGRPRNVYNLNGDGRKELEQTLGQIRAQAEVTLSSRGMATLFDEVGEQFERWRFVNEEGAAAARAELAALRVTVRKAWEDLARANALGGSFDLERMKQLAECEREAAIVEPPQSGLPTVAAWLARRLARASSADATREFAAQVMWMRSEARSSEAPKITAAALCASVWADEAVVPVDSHAMERCLDVAKLVNIQDRIRRCEWALHPNNISYEYGDSDAQAVVRGLTACQDTKVGAVRDWLGAFPMRIEWRRALAPMILHGLLWIEDCVLPHVVETFGNIAKDVLQDQVRANPGRRRREAFDFTRRALLELGVSEKIARFSDEEPISAAIVERFSSKTTSEILRTEREEFALDSALS